MAEREAEMQGGNHNEEPRLYISLDPKVCDDNLDMIEFLLVVTLTNTSTLESMSQVLTCKHQEIQYFCKSLIKEFCC